MYGIQTTKNSSTLPSILTVWTHLRSSRRSVKLHCSGLEYINRTIGSIRTLRRGRLPPLSLSIDLTAWVDDQSEKGCEGEKEAACGFVRHRWSFVKIPWLFFRLSANQLRCLSNTTGLYSTHFQPDNPDLAFGLSLLLCCLSEEEINWSDLSKNEVHFLRDSRTCFSY